MYPAKLPGQHRAERLPSATGKQGPPNASARPAPYSTTETLIFAEKIGAKKIGIATCAGTIREARTFVKILRKAGFEAVGAACKVGNKDKTLIGIEDCDKVHPGNYEPMCNPILQAKILNAEKTDLNVMMGLCVGHDSLFIKYSEAPVTVLFTKDRVTGHNAVQPLYLTESYYKRLV